MIHTVNLEITTHCDQRCPDCCAGVGINRVLQHHSWEYFVLAAKYLHGVDRINITGGEPTIHPGFSSFSRSFRRLFGCRLLTLSTNGARVERYADVIAEQYDWVDFSDYHLGRSVECLRSRMKVNVADMGCHAKDFIPRIRRTSGKPCSRACWISQGCAYADGKFWGCCVAQGITGSTGMEPCENWQEMLPKAELPCKDCWFAE